MRFLLAALNAKYIHSNPALYSLKAYALRRDPAAAEDVELAEYTINQPLADILADLYRRRPDVLAFSCYIWNRTQIRELTEALRKLCPGLPLWLGGPEVSWQAEAVLRGEPHITGVMVGEGEATFAELLAYYRRFEAERIPYRQDSAPERPPYGRDLATGRPPRRQAPDAELREIAGLVFRDEKTGEILRTPPREALDMDELPFLYEDLSAFDNRILYYESSRGCPFRCGYCLSSLDRQVRFRSPELVKKELQFFLDRRVPQVKFLDRTFNCSHTHAKAVWHYLLEHDNGITNFHFEIAAELLDEEELSLLARMRPGLVQLEIGVQSTNPRTLEAVRRPADCRRLAEMVGRIVSGGNVHVHLDLIAGLPYEDLTSFQKSFDDVYRMRPHQLQLGFLKVLKGSYMEEMAEAFGIVSWETPPYEVLFTRWLSFSDVTRLKGVEAMVELYYNSGQFSHMLAALEERFESPFGLFCALADFYSEKGLFVNSPSRLYRYQVLLEFAAGADAGREQMYRDLAVYDLYLRENLKSRPDFAGDLSPWHDRILLFYKEEEENRRYLPDYGGYSARQLQRMTHLEVFGERAVLFDYRHRDPVTGSARTVAVKLAGSGAAPVFPNDGERSRNGGPYKSDPGFAG